jgi:hypothetical protein
MRIIGIFNPDGPVVFQRVFDLRRNLLVRQRGQKRKLPLRDTVLKIGHHNVVSP